MATAAQVAIDIVADSSKATTGFDKTGRAAQAMADDLAAASRTTSRSMDDVASSADDLGGKAGKATGALGALSSGAELGGPAFEKYGAALQSAALATDFLSGIGDTLNLVLESTIVQNARARAATIAKAVAEKTAAAASKTMTAAQWALNAAMSANPIGLVVVAITALVAGLVLAYKKSETFRQIVQAAGRAGAAAIGWIIDKVAVLVRWVADTAPRAWNTLKDAAISAFRLITTPHRLYLELIIKLVGWVRDNLPKAFQTLRDKAVAVGDAILAPFRTLWDLIQDIIGAIKKIKIPDLPDLNPFNRLTGRGVSGAGGGVAGPATVVNNYVTVNGVVGDPEAVLAWIQDGLDRRAYLVGGGLGG